MNYLEHLKVFQRVQKLDCEASDQIVVESLNKKGSKNEKLKNTHVEVIDFQKLKQVHAHQLKANAKMFSKDDIVV